MKVSESDLYEDRVKFEEEKKELVEQLGHTENYELFVHLKHRIDTLTILINYIDKISGE